MIQGSFFAVLPSREHTELQADAFTPRWHIGNIYAMKASPSNVVQLPHPPSPDKPTTYDLFLSGDYEVYAHIILLQPRANISQIRLFGDPTHRGTEVPKLSINFSVNIQVPEQTLKLSEDHNVAPNFVDGWAFGEAIGVGMQSVDGWWTVTEVKISNSFSTTVSVRSRA